MSAQLVRAEFGPKAPRDLAAQVRAIADAIDAGKISAAVIASIGAEYEFVYGGSLRECLELSTLLQSRCIERYKA